MRDTNVNVPDPDILVSLPLFCKLTGMSMSELSFHEYSMQMKPEYNNWDWTLHAAFRDFDSLRSLGSINAPSEDRQFMSDFFIKTWKL